MRLHSKLTLLALLALLTSCAAPTRAKPVPFQCPQACYDKCADVQDWTGRKDDDYLVWLQQAHIHQDEACDAQRELCAQCLIRLQRAGVIQ